MDNTSKYKYLAKNTAIFAVGTFGSKILTFLIVPIYTYYLSTEDYGNIDLFSTAISLMLPFTTLVIYESIIRFLPTYEIDKDEAISISMLIFMWGTCITFLGIPVYKYLFNKSEFVLYFIVCLIFNSYNQIFGQYLRARGKSISFSLNGMIITVVTVFSNVIFLLIFRCGVYGYLYSLILAQLLAGIQCTIAGDVLHHCSFRSININFLKRMLLYSIPLIPNNLMWWLMNAGDKYMINYFMGSSANGIYSLSMKLPTILNLIYSIFMQAWQLSALEEQKSGKTFYTYIFKWTSALLVLCTSCIIVFVKPIFILMIEDSFVEAWKYVPFLSIATLFSCFSTFAGVIYLVKVESHKSFITTFIGAITNLILNLILIKLYGLYGIAIGTTLGYVIVFLIRAKDAQKAIGMSFDMTRMVLSVAILFVQAVILVKHDEYVFNFNQIFLFMVIVFLYRGEIKTVVLWSKLFLHKKRKWSK